MQWALVLVPIVGISWYLVGFGVGIVVTLVVVGSYFLLYYVTKKTPDVPNPLGAAQDVTAQGDGTKTVVAAKTTVAVAPPKRSDFAVPNYDVPHVTFNKTPDGFTVYFKKAKIGTHRVLSNVHQGKSASDAAAGLLALGVVGALHLGQGGSNIEVNREAVIIDGKKMARRDFGGFHISHTWKGAHIENNLAVLGYTFGSQSYEFGGGWDERKGTEVAAALNRHLRETPMVGDESVATPDVLREARPSDF
jgi:hypothetical protein